MFPRIVKEHMKKLDLRIYFQVLAHCWKSFFANEVSVEKVWLRIHFYECIRMRDCERFCSGRAFSR